MTKQNTASIFNVDLGGGLYGSTGNNRSFGNTGKDLQKITGMVLIPVLQRGV